ncbi:Zinc finger, UBP-type [Corchorus capsularis]|uniref:Zinc finger, UBP-type n=1 Tax=Corchorus capsularis TaxID=210143 RepID=A0A1R3IF05_COCAP|nr:Zinc finger, UBP-type [Corchorus capsularis]
MFILRVHSVDTEQPIGSSEEIEFYATTSPSKPNPQISERRGVIHLYRKASKSSLPNPSTRSTTLFVVAVPNYLSAVDFIRFAGPHLDNIVHLLFIRNDGIEDRYSVIINLVDQSAADGFYRSLNGKRFSPAEAEFCHILFTHSVEYTESCEIASTPPVEYMESESCEIASTPPVEFTESGEIASTPPVEYTESGETASTPPVEFTDASTPPVEFTESGETETASTPPVEYTESGEIASTPPVEFTESGETETASTPPVEYTESGEIASTPPVEFTESGETASTPKVKFTESGETASKPKPKVKFMELPTCPICLERLDPDTSGILHTFCDHSFQCSCTSKWTYLSCTVCRFCQQQDEKPSCSVCGSLENLWICLICGFMGCGRYKEGHAVRHWKDTQHCYSLELISQQIWDYVGDKYAQRLNPSKVDGKSVEMSLHCTSLEGNCGSCGNGDDSGIREAIRHSKVEATFDEYSRLLATEWEKQRQNYESLLAEAKSKRESLIADAVKTATSGMQDIQSELEQCTEEKNALAEINRDLIKNQKIWSNKVKEIEEREAAQLKLKDEIILDLEEQIRDIKVYIEAQKTLKDMTDSDGIKGGTLLPVPPTQSSSANTKKHKKSGRRRN